MKLPEGCRMIIDPHNRLRIVSMLAEIAERQANCQHEFNPTIVGGWYDGRDVRVCKECGEIEVPAPTVSPES